MYNKRWQLALIVLLAISCLTVAQAAPRKRLWPYWDQVDPLSTKSIDFSAWQKFLDKYIKTTSNGLNLVAYQSVSNRDKKELDAFIKKMSQVKIFDYNRAEQFAYWVNLYNALIVQMILQHYPIRSIMDIDISPGVFVRGPFGAKLIKVNGVALSLNDIEHRILRPIWNDPRTHYALNCASLSCPNVQKTAFTAANKGKLLNEAAAEYINSPRATRIVGGRLYVSSIYVWFKRDFGGTDRGVIDHLRIYAEPKLARRLRHINTISGDSYNWNLNNY